MLSLSQSLFQSINVMQNLFYYITHVFTVNQLLFLSVPLYSNVSIFGSESRFAHILVKTASRSAWQTSKCLHLRPLRFSQGKVNRDRTRQQSYQTHCCEAQPAPPEPQVCIWNVLQPRSVTPDRRCHCGPQLVMPLWFPRDEVWLEEVWHWDLYIYGYIYKCGGYILAQAGLELIAQVGLKFTVLSLPSAETAGGVCHTPSLFEGCVLTSAPWHLCSVCFLAVLK